MEKIAVRPISSVDPLALSLIRRTFMRFEAPDYTEEGVRSFLTFVDDKNQMMELSMLGAYLEDKLTGVIAADEKLSHICLFFVDEPYQRRGIGRLLWEHVLYCSDEKSITVNSSPYAVEIYRKLGFQSLAEECVTDGMRYTPMRFVRNLD